MLHAGDVAGGRFRLIQPIGSGGMSSVWWARHELIGRDVALKLSPAIRDEQVIGRFIREAQIIGRFHHRNIVGVVDAGEMPDEGYLFLALELLRGAPLAARLIPNRPLPPEEVLPILIEVCAGLEAAHAEGVVHRDIKPENIVLAAVPGEGIVPKIVDFGISQITGACDMLTLDGQLLGTPSYMSPEQALGKRAIDARADLWAVGVILYEALSGVQPFRASNHHAVLHRIIEAEPAPLPPWIPHGLRDIAGRCLEKEPALRYPDAASLRADLEAAMRRLDGGEHAPLAIVSRPSTAADGKEAGPRGALLPAARGALERARRVATTPLRSMHRPGAPADGRGRTRGLRIAAVAALVAALLRATVGEQSREPARASVGPALSAALADNDLRPAEPASDAAGATGAPASIEPDHAMGEPSVETAAARAQGGAGDDQPRTSSAPRPRRRLRITSPGF